MAFCTRCGGEIEDGDKFCIICGNPLSGKPTSEQPLNESKETSLSDNLLICTKCGGENEDGTKFCTVCGNPLNGKPVSEQSLNESKETPVSDNLLVCTKCGGENEEGTKFCTVCGSPLIGKPTGEQPLSESRETVPNDNLLICTKCGGENEDGTKFCTVCGNPLGGKLTSEQPLNESKETPLNDSTVSASSLSDKPVTQSLLWKASNLSGDKLSSDSPVSASQSNDKPITHNQAIGKPPNKSGKVIKKKKKVFLWALIPLVLLGLLCAADIIVNKNNAFAFTAYNNVYKKITEIISPSEPEPAEKTGFIIYDDNLSKDASIYVNNNQNTLNRYHNYTPAEGEYAIHWNFIHRKYDAMVIQFNASDFTYFAENGFVLEFKAKANKLLSFDVKFYYLQYAVKWEIGYNINQGQRIELPPDGKWHTVRVPLRYMQLWRGFDPVTEQWREVKDRAVSWANISELEFTMLNEDGYICDIYLDDIKITK